ncbi:SCP2 sterol-binding domain-containing protein [Pacificibacter marinus]|uniref:SCP-2 sterol transfer family protein n=1 Tax=Pacificibacter marinus TaxID=658057 RepID=A0A1Y5T3V5_9RHOB|nr:SCP2 sterol-binding domain-containing protein [Pacificibacter marinus]SEK97630.1 SCP-2 sterol transfer family protein [Pacificibacter marinus]SLN53593.1 SCP-2 sterol transfer family protein [Pacificibacter marinus]
MSDFLALAKDALVTRLTNETFEKSVSLRIKDIGNILISGSDAQISDAQADCAIFSSQDTLTQILEGTLNPMKAVMFGKLKVKGDAATAMKFGNLFG